MLHVDHANRFMCYEWAHDHGGINLSDYHAVYSGVIEPQESITGMLEALYTQFNVKHPLDYTGRSMSVSDIVELDGKGFFFCDSIGFKRLPATRENHFIS